MNENPFDINGYGKDGFPSYRDLERLLTDIELYVQYFRARNEPLHADSFREALTALDTAAVDSAISERALQDIFNRVENTAVRHPSYHYKPSPQIKGKRGKK